jgi:hypothetical protein
MNIVQKTVLRKWRRLLWEFAKREWLSILFWSMLGALAAGLARLLVLDNLFRAFAIATYFPSPKHFDDASHYLPYMLAIGVAVVIAVVIYVLESVGRGLRSWIGGVTSGLCFLSFSSMFVTLTFPHGSIQYQMLTDFTVVAGCFVLGYVLHLTARIHALRTLTEDDLRVPSRSRSAVGTEIAESDDPIQSWREDALNRAPLVETLSSKLLIAKSPVISLFGDFGSGKTSILNLLCEHLGERAIVVSFSTWLPGSQETLTSYLLSDIANQCQKKYVVPGLSKSARRLASALAETVPFLKGYSQLLPVPTQRDDIESMKAALARLPKRIVVLLDEIDRMEREELLTLLKVVRGISSLPNLSFVCAAERKTLLTTVKGDVNDDSNLYFEKFFPVSIQVPSVNAEALRKAGIERLAATFGRRGWFANESEAEVFKKQIDGLWSERIAPFCRNLRAIGLLANDVGAAAALLKREVHPVDLTLVELLRRFKPAVYEIVGRNSQTLTGGGDSAKEGFYRTDKEKKAVRERLVADIRKAAAGDEQAERVEGVLHELFPDFDAIVGRFRFEKRTSGDDEKRISHPGMFPAYFRYELPQAMFSSVELEAFVRKFNAATTIDARKRLFLEELGSMEKGNPKRTDFLMKLSEAVKTMNEDVGRGLVNAAMIAADKYVYDSMFIFLAEAGYALRIVIRVAEKIAMQEREALLSQCILEAADDTMAFRVLTRLTGNKSDFDLGISMEQLYPRFAERMRTRYGPEVNPRNVDLTTSDKDAFNLWGHKDAADKATQYDFWLRYIGESRSRLARTFEGIFMPLGLFDSDPTPYVENKISTSDLKRLFEILPDDNAMTDSDRRSLRRLKRFLDGDFKNGIGFQQLDDPSEDDVIKNAASKG